MQLQRIWTDAEAEIRFWQLMRRIEDTRRPGPVWWHLTLGPRRAARRVAALQAEAEALVERFTLQPGARPGPVQHADAAPALPDQDTRLARIHSAIRVAATLANDAAGAATATRERRRP